MTNQRRRETIALVRGGKPRAAIVLGPAATHIEQYAAQELQRYICAATGARLPTLTTPEVNVPLAHTRVLIGRGETNPAIAAHIAQGTVSLSASEPGLDGYVIQTTKCGNAPILLLGGSCDRGTLYAAYELLERYLGAGFFWDGEHIPARTDLVLPTVRLARRPRFAAREYLQGCVFGYSSRWWGLDDWIREVDWAAKHKINQLYLTEGFAPPVAFKRAMLAFGVDLGPVTESEQSRVAMCRKVMDHARGLGMDIVCSAYTGEVPAAFRDAYPDAHYVERRWLDFPASYVLYPTDPLFKEVGCAVIREHNAIFGTSHIYNAEPYGETRPGADEGERAAIKTDFARAVAATIAEADPDGSWECATWAFRDREFWPPESVRRFVEAAPLDRFLIGDLWCEERPLYQEFEYFWGRRWGFGVLHSFGGNTNLHGDLADLIRRAQAVALDPRARRCEAFQIMTEVVHYNHLYYDLTTRLAWDPTAVKLDAFLRDYARRRYGRQEAREMSRCLKALADSVYSGNDLIPPLYQVRPDTDWALKGAPGRVRYVPGVRAALDAALGCAEPLSDSSFYRRDLVDIAREYLGLLYSLHFLRLVEAMSAQDALRLQRESEILLALLDDVERLLASDPACHFSRIIERARRVPGAAPDIERTLREVFTTLGSYDELLDYARRDFYELVRYYYRPRVESYLASAKRAVGEGRGTVEPQETDAQARAIAKRWIDEGYPVEPIPEHDVLAVVKGVAARWPVSSEDDAQTQHDLGSAGRGTGDIGRLHRPWDTESSQEQELAE